MSIRSEKTIYTLLEKHLRSAPYPMTCTNLMEISEIREQALDDFSGDTRDVRVATNKLSDTLGFMWRRGILTRFPSQEANSFARYAYIWDQQDDARPVEPIKPTQRKVGTSELKITELDDGILIEMDKFTVMIKPK